MTWVIDRVTDGAGTYGMTYSVTHSTGDIWCDMGNGQWATGSTIHGTIHGTGDTQTHNMSGMWHNTWRR